MAREVEKSLDSYEVSGKLLGFIADNAANNDTLTDKLEDRPESWDGQHNRVRCLAHVINLVTKATFWPFTPKKDSDETEDDENETHDDEEAGDSSVLEPNAIYEQECDDVSGEVDEESKILLGELTEAERKTGENVLKKIRGFSSAISKSDQKMTTLEEACTYHGIKFLRPIKVVKTRWNSQCDAFERHLAILGGAMRICTVTKYEHLRLEKYAFSGQEVEVLRQLLPMLKVRCSCFYSCSCSRSRTHGVVCAVLFARCRANMCSVVCVVLLRSHAPHHLTHIPFYRYSRMLR